MLSIHTLSYKSAGSLIEAKLFSPFGNRPKVKISMLSMWDLSNPIRPKESQISIEVSRLNLSGGADDPKNPADRLDLRNPNSHQRVALHACQTERPRPLSPGERERGGRKVGPDLSDKVAAQQRAYHLA